MIPDLNRHREQGSTVTRTALRALRNAKLSPKANRPPRTSLAGSQDGTAGHPTGGCETPMIAILQSMLVAGSVALGDPRKTGGHYGASGVGAPDERASTWAKLHGEPVAQLVEHLNAV